MTQSTLTHPELTPKTGETVWLWLIKLITGPLLVVLLGLHLVINHFAAEGSLLTYADVVAYYQNPIVPVMEIAFLAVVVTHSLIGLRGILLDLKPSRGLLKLIDWALLALGIVSVSYGVWLVLRIVSKGV